MKLQNSDLFVLQQCYSFGHKQIALLIYSTTFFSFNMFFDILSFYTRLISNSPVTDLWGGDLKYSFQDVQTYLRVKRVPL
jgi:hypothetical protein